MSKIEAILSRAMSDPKFAELLFNDPDGALVEYDLSPAEMAKLKSMSRTEFKAMNPEQRKSLAGLIQKFEGGSIEGEVTTLPIAHD